MASISFDKFYNIVDGKQRGAEKFHHGVDPTNSNKLWDVPIATKQDVDDAVVAAQKAFKTWSQTTIDERKQLLEQFVKVLQGYEQQLTDMLCKESGKPRMFANGEIKNTKNSVAHHLTLTIPTEKYEDKYKIIETTYVPLGVAGAICPWNFPVGTAMAKILPALVTGCCIIVKPSEFTPYTLLKVVELMQQTFPPGVVQAVGGDASVGPLIVAHPGVAKISFTGSIATGKKIYAACAQTVKRITLELGGNDACIVCEDADLDKHVQEVTMGCFFNSGQVCVASKRIYIHEKIYDEFLRRMVEFTKGIKVGASDEQGVLLGPVQNEMQFEKVKDYFADSQKQGYKFATGQPQIPSGKGGFFIQPTIIDNPPNESRIIQEEPFGPIVPTQPWSDEDEVIARANSMNVGLAGSVFSTDIARAQRIARRLETGSVFINSFAKVSAQGFFGGHKESGLGGELGNHGHLAYMNAQCLHTYK